MAGAKKQRHAEFATRAEIDRVREGISDGFPLWQNPEGHGGKEETVGLAHREREMVCRLKSRGGVVE
jgi:hypothetical protein